VFCYAPDLQWNQLFPYIITGDGSRYIRTRLVTEAVGKLVHSDRLVTETIGKSVHSDRLVTETIGKSVHSDRLVIETTGKLVYTCTYQICKPDGRRQNNTKFIKNYTKIVGLVKFWPVGVSRFCTTTSHIGRKIDKILEIRFLCV
jgi:hypothetical protein